MSELEIMFMRSEAQLWHIMDPAEIVVIQVMQQKEGQFKLGVEHREMIYRGIVFFQLY